MLLRTLTSRAEALLRSSRSRSSSRSSIAESSSRSSSRAPSLPSSALAPRLIASSASVGDSQASSLPHLLVFGGNGFVGTRVCQAALAAGLGVVSVSRSGRPLWASTDDDVDGPSTSSRSPPDPPSASEAWVRDVEWVSADAFDVDAWKPALEGGCVGVVSTLGAFGSNEFMERVCGDANVAVFEAAAAAGVPRATFVSVHDYGLPSFVLPGYFGGKKKAERKLFELYPGGTGVALRPGFVYGTRKVSAGVFGGGGGATAKPFSVPLGAIGAPLDAALSLLPTRSIARNVPLAGLAVVPPVRVEALARAAVAAATGDPKAKTENGILDAWEIKERFGG